MKIIELPPIEDFYNTLKDESCSPEKYAIMKELWAILGSFEKLHDLYLALTPYYCVTSERNSDANFYFSLDPSHYYSLPGYSWAAMLYYTGVELELLSEEDKYSFYEKSMW